MKRKKYERQLAQAVVRANKLIQRKCHRSEDDDEQSRYILPILDYRSNEMIKLIRFWERIEYA